MNVSSGPNLTSTRNRSGSSSAAGVSSAVGRNGGARAGEVAPASAPVGGPTDTSDVTAPEPTAAQALLDQVSGQTVGFEREIRPAPGGGFEATESISGPDYNSSYQTVLDSNGEIVERNYSSRFTSLSPAVMPDEMGLWHDTSLVSEKSLSLQEQQLPDGTVDASYQKQEERYFAHRPEDRSVTTESSESNIIETVFTRESGRDRVRSEEKPPGAAAPTFGEGSPIRSELGTATLPDGSLQRSQVVADELSGYMATETVTVDPNGEAAVRSTEKLFPSEVVTGNLDGLGILSGMGHDSAQTLYDEHLGDGPITQRSGTSVTEQLDADGNVLSSNTVDTTMWSNEDGSRSLTMIDRGDQQPPEYVLTITNGDEVATQRFIGGTEDTEITRRFVDEAGFQTVEIESQTAEAADRALAQGRPAASEHALNTSRLKGEATLDDLRTLLGEDFSRLASQSPEFGAITEGLKGSTFALLEMDSRTQVVSGDDTSEERHRVIGISTSGGVRTLTFDAESNRWTVSEPVAGGGPSEEPTGHLNLVRQTSEAVQASVSNSPTALLDHARHLSLAGSVVDPLKALSLTTMAQAARGIGLAGSIYMAGSGAYDLLANGNPRGIFDIVSGGGSALGLLGVVSAPISVGAAVVGGGGAMVYDYIDRTDMAEVQI